MLIGAQIETRAADVVIDEDQMPNLGWVWGDYTRKHFNLVGPGEHYYTAIGLWNGDYKIDWDELIKIYVEMLHVRGEREYIPRERWLHADKEIREVLDAYVAYLVSQFTSREEDETNPDVQRRSDDEKIFLGKWDVEKFKSEAKKPWPEFKAARQRYRQAVDKVLRKLKDLSVTPKAAFMHNVRVTTPVDFRGDNKILAVIEDFDVWLEYKRDKKAMPPELEGYDHVYRVHYLKDQKVMNTFIDEVSKSHGKYFKLEYLHGTRGPSYSKKDTRKKEESLL